MIYGLMNSLQLAWPMYMSISFYFLAGLGHLVFFDLSEKVALSFFGMFSIDIQVQAIHLRLFCGLIATVLLVWVPLRDYTIFFPQHLDMMLSFDDVGIKNRFEKLPGSYQRDYSLHRDWKSRKSKFFLDLELKILSETTKCFVASNTESLSGRGGTTFFVKKIALNQKYKIDEANGSVVLTDVNSEKSLRTNFILKDTTNSIFSISLAELFLSWKFTIEPIFRQVYRIDPVTEVGYENLTVITSIRFFPIISVGDSLYLMKKNKRYVPVGYCVYSHR